MKKSMFLQMIVAISLLTSANAAFAGEGSADCKSKSQCKGAKEECCLPMIKRDDLKSSLNDVTLVNALSEKSFERSRVKGSLNITKDNVAKVAPEVLKDKDAKIVVYCMNEKCHASDAVGAELKKLGYTNVSIYREGLQDLIANGFDVEGSNPKEPIPPKTASNQ